MTAPKSQEPCPDCDREVTVLATRGGRGTNGITEYGVTCECGLVVDHLGPNGEHRRAVGEWNRWAKQRRAARPAPPQRSRTRDAAPAPVTKVRLTRPPRTGEVFVRRPSSSAPPPPRIEDSAEKVVVGGGTPYMGAPHPPIPPARVEKRGGEVGGTPESVFSSWQQLSAADRKKALALMSLEQQKGPTGEERDLDMWAEAVYEALAAAIGPSDGPAHGPQVVKRSVAPHAFWDPVSEFMRVSRLADLSPAHRLAAYRVLAGIVVKRARDIARRTSAPLGPKLVATCSQQIAGLFDNNYPGYLASGLAAVIVGRLLAPGQAPRED